MKLTKDAFTKLTDEQIERLSSISRKITYNKEAHLFYEGQVPVVAYLLIKGSIVLYKSRNNQNIIPAGTLVASHYLLDRTPMKVNAKVTPGTELCFLDTSTLKELIQSDITEIKEIFAIHA